MLEATETDGWGWKFKRIIILVCTELRCGRAKMFWSMALGDVNDIADRRLQAKGGNIRQSRLRADVRVCHLWAPFLLHDAKMQDCCFPNKRNDNALVSNEGSEARQKQPR